MNKIGVGILTYNRPETFSKTLDSIPKGLDIYVVYADRQYPHLPPLTVRSFCEFGRTTCISWCKNQLLRMMINDDCKHLFLLEDDIEIIDPTTFEQYIKAAETSGILSLCYKGDAVVKNSIDINGANISFADKPNRSFIYYPKSFIKTLGFYDERYDKSTLEQIDLTYRHIKAGVLPPWGWFADIEGSENLIRMNLYKTPTNKESEEYKQRYWYECNWFKHKYGSFHFQLPIATDEAVLNHIEKLKDMYGKKQ